MVDGVIIGIVGADVCVFVCVFCSFYCKYIQYVRIGRVLSCTLIRRRCGEINTYVCVVGVVVDIVTIDAVVVDLAVDG